MPRARMLCLLVALTAAACDRPEPTAPLPKPQIGPPSRTIATLSVTSTADAGAGSLRDAIASAANNDVITFDASLDGQTITLTSGELLISGKTITIQGSSAGITISGNNTSRVFNVAADGGLILTRATITDGYANAGGGIFALGSLTVDHSTIAHNTASGIYIGGGIYSSGPLSVVNSTISDNQSGTDPGGGGGGGLGLGPSTAPAQLVNATVTGNGTNGSGAGLIVERSVTLDNTIVAGNTAPIGGECFIIFLNTPANINLAGMNLSDDTSCGTGVRMLVADAMLGPLASNGGPTQTHALLFGSPAIDAAVDCTVSTDQRYVSRPQGLRCDIGAYEFTDFKLIPITVDPSGTTNTTTGAALLSGTVSCPDVALTVNVEVSLTQTQKSGKVYFDLTGTGATQVNCSGTPGAVAWAAIVTPTSGAFGNGTSTATATSTGTLPSGYLFVPMTSAVKLFWAKG